EGVLGKQRDDLIGARQPEMSALVWREFRDCGAEQFDLARIRLQVAGDLVEQGGLARPVGADDEMTFAGPDRHRYVLRHRQAAERLVQMYDLERERGRHRAPPRSRTASRPSAGMIPAGISSTMNRNTRPS